MPLFQGVVQRLLPSQGSDGTGKTARATRYGEQVVGSLAKAFNPAAEEGSYYVARHQTPGTAQAYSIQATFSATVAALGIRNAEAGGGKFLYMDYIKAIVTVAPANATGADFALALDSGSDRISAGTSLSSFGVNSSIASSATPEIIVTPTVAAATGAVRYICRERMRANIPTVSDTWVWNFGSNEMGAGNEPLNGNDPSRMVFACPPVVLGPNNQEGLLLHLWFPGNATTAMSAEWEVGFVLR